MDKPAGLTSHDVVARVRRALGTRSVGHTGTLDPFATGLLVVLVGRATRLARYIERQEKTYDATARLGVATTTDDLTGEPLPSERPPGSRVPPREEVEAALSALQGASRQRPPVYSAKHVGGERSYARARRGDPVALADVDIVVRQVELLEYAYPDLRFRATVSAGTYLRALARDLGERLGSAAHLRALRREAIGALSLSDAVALDEVDRGALRPPLEVLGHLFRVEVSDAEAEQLAVGKAVALGAHGQGPVAATAPDGRLVAVGELRDGAFQPEVVLEARA